MVGKYKVEVDSGRDIFTFEVSRKYTVVCGMSGEGKTLLSYLVGRSKRISSSITIKSKVPVNIVEKVDYVSQLGKCIAIIDEDVMEDFYMIDMYKTFVDITRNLDAYFVLITRHSMSAVPYSCLELYKMVSKYVSKYRIVHSLERMYSWEVKDKVVPDCIITEDSKSGNNISLQC